METQGSFWSLRENFLTQRVATLICIKQAYLEYLNTIDCYCNSIENSQQINTQAYIKYPLRNNSSVLSLQLNLIFKIKPHLYKTGLHGSAGVGAQAFS